MKTTYAARCSRNVRTHVIGVAAPSELRVQRKSAIEKLQSGVSAATCVPQNPQKTTARPRCAAQRQNGAGRKVAQRLKR